MRTINSLSGGKTSSYIAVNYPADYNIFSLVRTSDKKCKFPDEKIRKQVEDRIQTDFIGTVEMNEIVYTMLDLEQMLGTKIDWVTGVTFDELIKKRKFLPNVVTRFCTTELKIEPIKKFWLNNVNEICEMRLGFRANEQSRAQNVLSRCVNGVESDKFIIGKHKNGNNKWKQIKYRKPVFPLITDGIFKDKIEEYWKGKNVRFAYMNNCVGCFHRSVPLLNHVSHKAPKQFDWFVSQEKENFRWKKETKYSSIKSMFKQISIFDDEDFNDCDSGYCGL